MLKIHNTLSKKEEIIEPIKSDSAGIYTCGPTVYDYVTIGNWRTYTLGDLVNRVLRFDGIKTTYIMNITDVGHLTGDNSGDADTGEDRMEKAKKREGKTAWDIAEFYAADFLEGYKKLNLTQPDKFVKATDHIQEQIDMVKKLEEKGLAYKISDGIYFDTAAYEALGFQYGELSNLESIKEGARVEINPEKKNPRDFALWKFSPTNEKRDMEWQSPWGVGFPGWHIECSAMSEKYLGEQFDIHVGGEDLKSTHHPNEIAQAQGSSGKKPFVKYWIHGAFLQVDGGKMGKSLGNAYNLHDIEKKGFSPIDLRYFYLTANFKSPLNFTWESLEASQNALKKLKNVFLDLGTDIGAVSAHYKKLFTESLEDNLNTPKALATMWELINDKETLLADKHATLLEFDKVLGLGMETWTKDEIPTEVLSLAQERNKARLSKDWTKSDELRDQIKSLGYEIKDLGEEFEVRKI
jgi:cysteinyl-tRNA synthetase